MGNEVIYRVRIHGVEYVGSAEELCEKAGYCKAHFRSIANGNFRCPEGLEFLPFESEPKTSITSRERMMFQEWDSVVSMFDGIRWVRSGGRRLRIR